MEHMHVMDHPSTFDEVIKRGFPTAHLEMLEEARKARRAAARPAPLVPLQKATQTVARKDASRDFTAAEQTAFKAAIEHLVQEGTYEQLIRHHMDMSHNMHGSMGEVGLYRFLGWHRRYLVAFERELQRVDKTLRPTAKDALGVPYWRWDDPIPAWMSGFLPAHDPQTGAKVPKRKLAPPPQKASAADLTIIVDGFKKQAPQVAQPNDYTKFTWGVEGWGTRPDGSSLPAHNHGHAWIGGIMNNTSTSPTDPMFWLHHAEVDRLWSEWRKTNPTAAPPLQGTERVMDPWAESYDDLLDTKALGYTYA